MARVNDMDLQEARKQATAAYKHYLSIVNSIRMKGYDYEPNVGDNGEEYIYCGHVLYRREDER